MSEEPPFDRAAFDRSVADALLHSHQLWEGTWPDDPVVRVLAQAAVQYLALATAIRIGDQELLIEDLQKQWPEPG